MKYLDKEVLNDYEGGKLIEKYILSGKPFYAGKLGMVEINFYSAIKYKQEIHSNWLYMLDLNAGVFPYTSSDTRNVFFDLYNESICDIDILGVWIDGDSDKHLKEREISNEVSKKAELVQAGALEPLPIEGKYNWLKSLEGKKVCIISPFSDTIQSQWNHKDKIFKEAGVLPNIELSTIKSFYSKSIDSSNNKSSWVDCLLSLRDDVLKDNSDIYLIGAGAYSLPLCKLIKNMGKVGIHCGGGLQLLFGIMGKRWENNSEVNSLYNQTYLCRPMKHEVPINKSFVEGGCYW